MRRTGSLVALAAALAIATPFARADKQGQAPRPIDPGTPGAAPAEDASIRGIAGAYTYKTQCASCHGADGRGEAPAAEGLRYHPPDLTLLARRHGGAFPFEKVVRIVDGREPLKGHGGPDMPVWGDAFKNADTGYDERRVKEKVRAVVEYLRTIQAR